MRKVILSGRAFYMLDAGEPFPNHTDADFRSVSCAIFPQQDGWTVRAYVSLKWEPITNQTFDSENEAFNYAYKWDCDRADEAFRFLTT